MGHSLRALVVEDSQDDALLLKHRLLQAGYDIVDFARVETPEEMAAALDKGGWDIIIADYSLPQTVTLHLRDIRTSRRRWSAWCIPDAAIPMLADCSAFKPVSSFVG